MNNSVDWSLIPAFLAVMEKGNLSAAAQHCHHSQPTISRHIQTLETQLGLVLFERTGKGLRPTPHAHALVESAGKMRQAAFELERIANNKHNSISGNIRVSATQPVAYQLLMPIIASFQEQYPQLSIDLIVNNEIDNLLEREADIALRMTRPSQVDLIAKKITSIPTGFFAHEDYLKRHGIPRSFEDLGHHRFIGDDRQKRIINGAKQVGQNLTRDGFSFRTDDLMAQWLAVKNGLGVGVISHYLAEADPKVSHVLADIFTFHLPLWLVCHRELRSNKAIRLLFDHIVSHLPRETR